MQKTNPNKKIPTGWREVKLGGVDGVCEIVNGSTPKRSNSEFWENGSISWFTIDDIRANGRMITETIQKITEKALEKTSVKLLPENTVLLCCTASIGEVAFAKISLTTNQQFNGLISKGDIEPDYLYFVADKIGQKLKSKSGQTTINYLSVGSLGNEKLLLPPKSEQQKIAEILMAVDTDIEKVGEIITKTEKLKKDLMQELFTPKKGWEKKVIKNVAKLRKEKFDPKKEGLEKYIGLEHIEQGTGQLLEYSDSNTTKSIKSRFKKGDILFNKLRPYLKKYWFADFSGVCTTELLVFINKENILKEFLYYILSSDDFISFINSKTFGTKMPRADWDLIKDYRFYMPETSEQKQIAETLSAIDQKIQINKTLQAKLINLKKGLMQDLLSGEVRVKL